MPLKNHAYNLILRKYDRQQLQNKRELDLRITEVYVCVPRIEEIDHELVKNSVSAARSLLLNSSTPKSSNDELLAEKQVLLEEAGFPADYLELKYQCPDCRDTGFIENQKCHCFRQAIVNLLYSQSNVQTAIQKENFSTFSYHYYDDTKVDKLTGQTALANIKKVVATIQHFIQSFDEEYHNLLLYGNTGVGKTFLTNCIAKELLDSAHTVVYLTSYQLFHMLERYTFGHEEQEDGLKEQVEFIQTCDLLIIDDLGTELTNAFINSELYSCINERHLQQKSTVISTNLSFEQLQHTYSERISSRITSNYLLLRILGDDIRLKKLF